MLFGRKFEGGGFMQGVDERVNELARISNTARQIGRDLREFARDVADNPVTKFIAELAGHGFKFFLVAAGITVIAAAIRKLARAMFILSGAGAAVAAIRGLAGMGGALLGGRLAGAAGGAAAGAAGGAAARGGATAAGAMAGSELGKMILKRIPAIGAFFGAAWLAAGSVRQMSDDNMAADQRMASPREAEDSSMRNYRANRSAIDAHIEDSRDRRRGEEAGSGFLDMLRGFDRALVDKFGMKANTGGDQRSDLKDIRDAIHAPKGTQDVRVTNPIRPNVNVSVTVNATTNASPDAIGQAAADQVRAALEGSFDGGAI